jgi:flagellar motor switch protein FliN/FliY
MADGDQARDIEPPPSHAELWPEVLELPCHLDVELRVPGFRIRDLLSLEVDSIVDTQRSEGAHVPVVVNGVMVAWAEFDVMEDRLAVRLTEIV